MSGSDLKGEAWHFLKSKHMGFLATQSAAVAGFPMTSWVPYYVTPAHAILVLMSPLAEHFQNIAADPKVCLGIIEHPDSSSLDQKRLACFAEAIHGKDVPAADREGYLNTFSEARFYEKDLHFVFVQLKLLRMRYIAGFGKAAWVEL